MYRALFNKDGETLSIYAKVVILATGGIGGLFKNLLMKES